jgi:6-pyruvoyl-tetrahydropterin synthase
MEKRTVEKAFKWEMAHRLLGKNPYTGEIVKYCDNCRNLHGHSYKATIVMRRTEDGGFGSQTILDEFGMIYDYNKMKKMKVWIDENLDHCVMISKYDTELLEFIKSQEGRDKHFVIVAPTTAENICMLLFGIASSVLNDTDGKVIEVRVKETESSEAMYRSEE